MSTSVLPSPIRLEDLHLAGHFVSLPQEPRQQGAETLQRYTRRDWYDTDRNLPALVLNSTHDALHRLPNGNMAGSELRSILVFLCN